MQFATKEGTFSFLKQFPNYSKDFYRFTGDAFVSSLGIGTFRKEPYREENYIISYKDAVKTAVLNGVNVIDTAINYRYQMSEQEIGEALQELFEEHEVSRDQLFITSKAGFIPLEFPFPSNPYEWIEEHLIEKGLAGIDDIVIDQHCMRPEFLRWSVEQSLQNLGLQTLDVLFLHNPETQLGYVEYDTLKSRVLEAFKLFEQLVQEGKIKAYGIATWNGFLYEEGHTEYISLRDMVDLAIEAGGEQHHFKYIEAPYNLGKTQAYTFANQQGPDGRYYTLMQAMYGYGLQLFASSSLLQMNLFKGEFSNQVREVLGTNEVSDVISALQFSRTGPLTALAGMQQLQHVEDNLLLAYLPGITMKNIDTLLKV